MDGARRADRTALAVWLLGLILFAPVAARAGEWRVAPIRLDLGREAKSGVITVINEKPERLHVRLEATEWTQDAEGKDRYEETGELVFFPKVVLFEKDEERIVRAGIRVPATKVEKTYRLFIEEIPERRRTEGANVAIAIRFGVPVFVKPLKEQTAGAIEKIGVEKGTVSALVRNTGNIHFVIHSVTVRGKDAQGKELFAEEIAGWYLLAGASRVYKTGVPRESCEKAAAVIVEVKADRLTLTGKGDVDPAMCAP